MRSTLYNIGGDAFISTFVGVMIMASFILVVIETDFVFGSLSLPILGLSGGSFGDAIKGSSSGSFAYGVVDSAVGFDDFIFHFNSTLVLLLLWWCFHY